MADNRAQAYAAELFEKAQGSIGMLSQIDSQISELLSQRRAIQNDLSDAQTQINEEFNRLMRESDELPARMLAEISGNASRAPEAAKRQNVAQAVAAD